VGLVLVVTAGAVAWLFLGQGDSGSSHGFVNTERRFAQAAAAVHLTPGAVHQSSDLHAFNVALDDQALVMEESLEQFNQIMKGEEGEAATIAKDALDAGTRALRAVSHLRDAIVTSANLSNATAALDEMDRAVDDLNQLAEQWKQL
jgi:hypothetical protein